MRTPAHCWSALGLLRWDGWAAHEVVAVAMVAEAVVAPAAAAMVAAAAVAAGQAAARTCFLAGIACLASLECC